MYIYLNLGRTNMDEDKQFEDLVAEYEQLKGYHENLISKAKIVVAEMWDILEQFKEYRDGKIR